MSWRDRIDVIVQAGLRGQSVGEFVWDSSHWDDAGATWSGVEPTWITIDNWQLEGFSTRRGRSSAFRRHSAGTAEIRLVWTDPAAGWSLRPASPVHLGQEIRILARGRSAAGEAITSALPIYRGAVREIADGWLPVKRGQALFRLTARMADRFADLAAIDLPAIAAEGLGDTSDERIARILGKAGIDTYYLTGDVGQVEHLADTFDRNLLDLAQLTIEGENGDFYVDRAGFFYVRQAYGTGTHAREDADQIRWTNDADTAGIGPASFGTGQALDDVVNLVSMQRTGGALYTVEDGDSQLRYGLRTYSKTDLTCRYDADVETAADYRLAQLAERTQRVDQLQAVILEQTSDDDLAALLDIEIGDRHLIDWSDGNLAEGTFHVQGIGHQVTGAEWRISVDLWAYDGEGLAPAPGRWDEGRWDERAWV